MLPADDERCTSCGETRKACYAALAAARVGSCCSNCANGNTHPSPGEEWDCQLWAAQHGPTAV